MAPRNNEKVRPGHTLPKPMLSAALLACLLGLTGCGGSRFGSDLSTRPKPRPMGQVQGDTLRLPDSEQFSIVLPQSSREAGLDGTADADAHASGAGTADATARVTHAGTAQGMFQLGHAFANDTDRQADFDFDVRFHYAFDVTATPESGYPDAQVGLRLYAQDSRGRMLRDLTLVAHSTADGPAAREGQQTAHLTVTLAPGEAVNVFLAGRVKVEIRAGRSAHGTLRLSDLRMAVATRPAPAVRTSGDEQE